LTKGQSSAIEFN